MLKRSVRFSEHFDFSCLCSRSALQACLAVLALLSLLGIQGCGVAPQQSSSSATLVLSDVSSSLAPGDAAALTVTLTGDSTKAAPSGRLQFAVTGPTAASTIAGSLDLPQSTLTIPNLTAGTYSIQVSYTGDQNYAPSTATRSFSVGKLTPVLTVLTPAPLKAFTSGSVGAAVRVNQESAPSATGSLTYAIASDPAVQGSCTLDAAAQCVQAVALPAGSWPVVWSYSGDGNYAATTASVVLPVAKIAPVFTLSAAQSSASAFGSEVFTAAVSGVAGAGPTGAVQWTAAATCAGGAAAGSLALPANTFTLKDLCAGTYTVSGSYAGDANYNAATASTTVPVAKLTPTLTLTAAQSSATALSDEVVTVALVGSSNGAPTGTVQWSSAGSCAGGSASGSLTLPTASFTLKSLCAGSYTVSGSYAGDANYNAVTATTTISVSKVTPTFTLTAAQSSAVATSDDGITATLAGAPSGGATGTIHWTSTATCPEGAVTGSVTLPANSFTLANLCGGTYTVSASYSGDANYAAQTASVVIQVAKLTPTLTIVVPSAPPNADGAVPLTLQWSGVTAKQVPTGAVSVACSNPALCDPAAVTLPSSSFSMGPFSNSGTTTLSAHYGGDDFYAAVDTEASLTTAAPFTVTVGTGAIVYPGQTASLQVSVAAGASSSGTVTVTLSDLPSGLTAETATIAIGGTGTIKLTAGPHVAAENFNSIDPASADVQRSITVSTTGRRFSAVVHNSITVSLNHSGVTPTQTYLPVLNLTTAAPIVDKDNYIAGTASLVDPNNSANNYSGSITLKGHGNSTWMMPKKPYNLKLSAKASLLGMAKAKSWVLLANWTDKTLLRNTVAFEVGHRLNMTWTPSSKQVEVYLNGSYQGIYQLSEKVQIDSNRLNLTSLGTGDISGDALTGGYLMQIDNYLGGYWYFYTNSGYPIVLSDPSPITVEQENYIQSTTVAADQAINSANFTDTSTGWPSVIDKDSFVKWYLVNEFMGNGDAGDFWSSDFFYKDRNDPLIHMGPIWDFDISSGNVNYNTAGDATTLWVAYRGNWYRRLLTDPVFHKAVHDTWVANRDQFVTMSTFIDTQAAALEGAQQNNYLRWPTLGEYVWPNPAIYDTYQGEVEHLKSWLTTRVATLDAEFGTQ